MPALRGARLHGRRAVLETLLPGTRFRARLGEGADGEALARAADHVRLRERAEALAAAGITTAAEVVRVLGPDAENRET